MKKSKKFFICWINDPKIAHDYYEIWSHDDLLKDFIGDNQFCMNINSLKLGKSFIHFDCEGHMMVLTRVPRTVETTI